MKKLAIISSHPIQYNAPLFALISQQKDICLKVFYTWSQAEDTVYDPGFGQNRSWDIPLLEGYEYEFVSNIAKKPGSHHFWGIQNPSLISGINDFSPHAILVFGWSFYSHLQVMRYFKGKIPVWFRGDSHLLDEPSGFHWKKILRRWGLTLVYKYIDKAFYVGEANRQYYLAHGMQASQLVFAPHAIDNQRFKKDHEIKEAEALVWRQSLGIPDDAITFLFVGKLETKKNPVGLVKAFIEAQTSAYLLIVGDGPNKNHIIELIKAQPKIILISFQNQKIMPIVYRLGNVLVLPSIGPGETWGLAVNEAFACSRPAVVSNKVGCKYDLILQDKTGWTFSYDDESCIVNLFKEITSLDLDKIHIFGKNAYRHITKYNYEEFIHAIKKAINN